MPDHESDISDYEKRKARIYAFNTEWDRGPNWLVRICFFLFSIPGCRCCFAGKI